MGPLNSSNYTNTMLMTSEAQTIPGSCCSLQQLRWNIHVSDSAKMSQPLKLRYIVKYTGVYQAVIRPISSVWKWMSVSRRHSSWLRCYLPIWQALPVKEYWNLYMTDIFNEHAYMKREAWNSVFTILLLHSQVCRACYLSRNISKVSPLQGFKAKARCHEFEQKAVIQKI